MGGRPCHLPAASQAIVQQAAAHNFQLNKEPDDFLSYSVHEIEHMFAQWNDIVR